MYDVKIQRQRKLDVFLTEHRYHLLNLKLCSQAKALCEQLVPTLHVVKAKAPSLRIGSFSNEDGHGRNEAL